MKLKTLLQRGFLISPCYGGLEPIGENAQWAFEFSLLGRLARCLHLAQAQDNSSPLSPTIAKHDLFDRSQTKTIVAVWLLVFSVGFAPSICLEDKANGFLVFFTQKFTPKAWDSPGFFGIINVMLKNTSWKDIRRSE